MKKHKLNLDTLHVGTFSPEVVEVRANQRGTVRAHDSTYTDPFRSCFTCVTCGYGGGVTCP